MTVVEFWVEQYQTVVAEKNAFGDKLRETLEENKELRQKVNRLEHSLTYTALKNVEANIEDLQTRLNNSRASNEAYRSMNSSLSRRHASTMHQTQELKMQLEAEKEENESLHNVIDSFVDKCKELEDKAEGYKKERDEKIELLNAVQDGYSKAELEAQVKDLTERYENTRLSLRIVNERLDKSIEDRSELQADRDIWFRKNGEKQAEIEELKKQLEYFTRSRNEWRDRAKHAEKELEDIKSEFKQSYADGYSDGNEEGQNELWEMLQMVKDMQPNEFDVECECLGDVIDMDLEDFKEAYGKWEAEQKKAAEEAKKQHVDYMRSYLKRYCIGKLCFGCPLYNASEPVSSCLFSKLTDEEVEKRYRKVIDSECKKVTAPISARLPQPWECTIEAKVEINKDLLKDICGIKPKEEEHKLEYGDAVRLPWCNYDYMYIAPDEKEETLVRLFDPNIHAIVTTHISNVRYNGGRILVSEEDDIRKIWKYMK